MDNNFFMQEAVKLATEHMLAGDGGPFGAVIVQDGKIIARGWNRVTSTNDPTAHAEIDCIRKACTQLNSFELTDCDLYANCEPCPMCLSAAYWAHIGTIYYGANQQDAAAAGFNDAFIYSELNKEPEKREMFMQQLMHDEALESFRLWETLEDKTGY
ncbi:MAG: tRNA-specific adenosine deaminase [Desulfocapsa sp.]|nr:MAG: tRNA-specific adenosine deaminase [Desulfocapsa sp.]